MSATGLKVFDDTLGKTNRWLNDIMKLLDWSDRKKAYQALRATLHTLRDRLMPDEVPHLGAQLPMLIRGIYYENWDPGCEHLRERSKQEFLSHIADMFEPSDRDLDFEAIAQAVFQVLNMHVDSGQIDQLRAMLPAEVRELWPVPDQIVAVH